MLGSSIRKKQRCGNEEMRNIWFGNIIYLLSQSSFENVCGIISGHSINTSEERVVAAKAASAVFGFINRITVAKLRRNNSSICFYVGQSSFK